MLVNQQMAYFKLCDAWKMVNNNGHPLKFETQKTSLGASVTRAQQNNVLSTDAYRNEIRDSAINNMAVAWNKMPITIKQNKSLMSAKKQIKAVVLNLPF